MLDRRSGKEGLAMDPTSEGDQVLRNNYLDIDKHRSRQCACTPGARCRIYQRMTDHVIQSHSEAITRLQMDRAFELFLYPPQLVVKEERVTDDSESLIKEHNSASGRGEEEEEQGKEEGEEEEEEDDTTHTLLRMLADAQQVQLAHQNAQNQKDMVIQGLLQSREEAVQLSDNILASTQRLQDRQKKEHVAEIQRVKNQYAVKVNPGPGEVGEGEEGQKFSTDLIWRKRSEGGFELREEEDTDQAIVSNKRKALDAGTGNLENTISCNQCDYRATRRGHLANHIGYVHTVPPISCDSCRFTCFTEARFQLHLRAHQRGTNICNDCKINYGSRGDLNRHKKTQHGEKRKNDKNKCIL